MESVQVEVKIELGHKASCKKKATTEGYTHDWVVFVRGPESCDISHFVEKVIFYLHESFAKPKRVLKEPPYQVGEAGYGSFFLQIEVYFKNKDEPRKVVYNYDLFLPVYGSPPIDNIRSEALTFKNPTDEFRRKLVKGGGTVTNIGAHNGFHSGSSPVNGMGGSVEVKDGKSINNQSETHNTAPLSTTLQESDKTKKVRTEKVVANKTVKTQEPVTTGMKRPVGSAGEDAQMHPVKKKKKKPDEGTPKTSGKSVGFIALEVSVPGSETKEKLEEMKDIKLKIKSLPSKTGSEKKKDRRASGEVGSGSNHSNSTKRRDSSSTKKSKQKEETKQSKLEDKKLEKITFRRNSGDSWSSSTSSSSLVGSQSTGNKNPALSALLAEIGDDGDDDDDDDDEVDIFTPFQSSSLQSGSVPKQVVDSSPNDSLQKKDSNTPANSQSTKGKTKSSSHSKKPDVVGNGRKNGLKSPTTESDTIKSPPSKQSPKPRLKDNKHGSNGQQIPPTELSQLYKRLVTLKDPTLLQRIADILEQTGRFILTDTTLDFDLCSLDKTTIKKIENSIGR